MADKCSLMPFPCNRPEAGRKGLLYRLASFYLAALLLFLTVCVDLLHTCTPPWLFAHEPLSPSINGGGSFTDLRQTPAGSPCLACFFLHALNATKITLLAFALSWLIFLQKAFPHWHPSSFTNAACPCPIRAPPANAWMS